MATRTPSSLKWLIVKRSRLAGALESIDSDIASFRAQIEELEAKKPGVAKLLYAIDLSLGLHDIQIEPTDIASVVPHRNQRLLPFGVLTRLIRRTLKQKGWMSTTDIAWVVFLHLLEEKQPCDLLYVTHVVLRRLCNLLKKGMVIRHQTLNVNNRPYGNPFWNLPGEAWNGLPRADDSLRESCQIQTSRK